MGAAGNRAVLDTLALAYLQTGEVAKAIETEEKAVSLLPPGDSQLRNPLEKNLARYRRATTGQPALPAAG